MKKDVINIIPLGGLGRIGANMTAVEYKDSIIVIDCGIAFPDKDTDADFIIPDISYLMEHRNNIKGFVITHGHEDHIGALPYIAKEFNVPVYGTRFTIGMVYNKLCEYNLAEQIGKQIVDYNTPILLGDIEVEFIKVNHSIGEAAALAVKCSIGTIIHTGDFKIDYTPAIGNICDIARLSTLGERGVLALLCDSTNAEKKGVSMSESQVANALDGLFEKNKSKRIIISTFASNIDRLWQIILTSAKYGRKVCIEGRSIKSVIKIAQKLDYIDSFDNIFIANDQLKYYKDAAVTLIITGSQGEEISALSKAANGIHERVKITPNDLIIFSSKPIPGNEADVDYMISLLKNLGATIISEGVHASGHACEEEIKLMYAITKPKFIIPIHGEHKHLLAQREIAKSMGYDDNKICIANLGDVISIRNTSIKVSDKVPAGEVLVTA